MDYRNQETILVKDWLSQWLDNKVGQGRKLNTQEREDLVMAPSKLSQLQSRPFNSS